MGRTKKITKADIVTADIHRKAGPHKPKEPKPKICPRCKGDCYEAITDGHHGHYGFNQECPKCEGLGVVYE